MQTMACVALILLHWGVLIFALEIYAVMALNTVKRQSSAASPPHEHKGEENNVYTHVLENALHNMYVTLIHHGVLSS